MSPGAQVVTRGLFLMVVSSQDTMLEVDSNLRPYGCNAQNIPLHCRVPLPHVIIYILVHCCFQDIVTLTDCDKGESQLQA